MKYARLASLFLSPRKAGLVAKLVPVESQLDDVFGCLKDEIKIVGDIESPVVPLEDWDALR